MKMSTYFNFKKESFPRKLFEENYKNFVSIKIQAICCSKLTTYITT